MRDDASLAARRVAVFSGGLYAAPAYLQRRGMPPEPEALMEHDALRLLAAQRRADALDAQPRRRALGRHSARPRDGQLTGAADAHGACTAPASPSSTITSPRRIVQRGELVQVLPDWRLPPATAWAVFPGRRLMPARTRVFLDALQEEFSGPKCQQAEAAVRRAKRERRAPA